MANERKLPQTRWDEYSVVDGHVSFEDDDNLRGKLNAYDAFDGVGCYSDVGRGRVSSDRVDTAIFPSSHAKRKYADADTDTDRESLCSSFDPRKKKSKKDQIFDLVDKLFPFFSIGLFFFDVTTDIILAFDYYQVRTWEYFWWTVAFIVVPSLITCILGLRLYILDYTREKEAVRKAKNADQFMHSTPTWLWFIRILMTLLQVGPVIRYIEHFYNGIKSQNKKLDEYTRQRHYKISKWDEVDVTMLRLFESFLESAPQLLVQLCILIIDKPDLSDVFTISHKTLAMLSSWIGSSWSLVAYHKTLRRSLDDKVNMKIEAIPVYFLWRLLEVGSRVLVFAFFASCYQYWIFLFIGVHWMIMSAWLLFQKTQFCPKKYEEVFFNFICGLILVFCFLNVREGHTRYRMLVYYIIFYTENVVLMLVWYHNTVDIGKWFHTGGMLITIIAPVVHISVVLFYYYCCHPSKNIKLCLTGDRYYCFESVCFTLKEREAYRQDTEEDRSNYAIEMTGMKQNGKYQNESPIYSDTHRSSMEKRPTGNSLPQQELRAGQKHKDRSTKDVKKQLAVTDDNSEGNKSVCSYYATSV